MKKLSLIILGFIYCLLCFSLCSCDQNSTNSTNEKNTANFTETVNGIRWSVTYNKDTKEIISILAQDGMVFGCPDTYSPFFRFMQDYQGYDANVVHSIKLSGVPIDKDLYKITQTDEYSAVGDQNDFEIIKQTFPSCTYSESHYTVFDYETGESYIATSGNITFHKIVSTFEMQITFSHLAITSEVKVINQRDIIHCK